MARTGHGRTIIAALALSAAAVTLGPSQAFAQGATDYPIPSTTSEVYGPIAEGFESPIEPDADLREPRVFVDTRVEHLKALRAGSRAPAFFRDTDFRATSRTYWFDEDSFTDTEPQALTTGGYISYQSGYLADFFQLRGVAYTSQPLYKGEDAGDSLNLTPDGNEITTLGQASARFKFAQQELTVGRQLVRTPFINPYYDRMIPLTYEGVMLVPEDNERRKLDYVLSYLWSYKERNQPGFIPLSEGLGVERDQGVLISGLSRRSGGWSYGVTNYWIKDTLNTAYAEVDYLLPFRGGEEGPSFRIGVNDLNQRTVGADLVAGAPYETNQASARLIAGYKGVVLTGAVAKTADGADIQNPFGFSPIYTAMYISSFDRAGELGYLVTLSYDFARIGLDGVKFQAGWGQGFDAINSETGASLANESELDLRLVYQPHRGPLQGLRLELEYIEWVDPQPDNPSDDLTQLRAIASYVVPLY
jgi:hypothetical protein